MEGVCGVIEHIFLKIKEGSITISEDLLGALRNSIIGLTNCIDSIDKENSEIDLSNIKSRLEQL
jgi:hypothetical protein